MASTTKCWIIANFEFFMFTLAMIAGGIIIFGFLGFSDLNAALIGVLGFVLFVINCQTKTETLQFGKYLLMVGGVIVWMYSVKYDPDISPEDRERFNYIMKWFWSLFGFASVVSAWLAYYTYKNIQEVLSRRMLWRNSNVSLYEYTWKYTLERFCNITVSIVTCLLWLIFIFFYGYANK